MESNFSLLKRLKLFSYSRKVKFIFLILLMAISSLADVAIAGIAFSAILTAPEVLMENEFQEYFFKIWIFISK